MIKDNSGFINKYGNIEFHEMCKFVYQELAIAKSNKKISNYRINKRKNIVKFYTKNQCIDIDCALIFSLGIDNIQSYIDKK